ncbi:MAG: tetratricopeptide repeat protein [Nitrospirae bacterium]|nr:tetratricopeptide repeat protein [Nitrospirota bacterium]
MTEIDSGIRKMGNGRLIWFIKHQTVVLLLVYLIAGGFIYANSMDNGFHYDDEFYIVKNEGVHHIENLPGLFVSKQHSGELSWLRWHYRPLTFTSYLLNYWIGGLNPAGWHLANILIHVLTAFLTAIVIGQLTGRFMTGTLAGLLFLVHPFNAEAVNFMTARSSQLYALFYLISLYAYLQFHPLDKPSKESGKSLSYAYLGLSFAAFLLSMLSKEMAVMLPVTLFLYEWMIRSPQGWRARLQGYAIPAGYVLSTVIPYIMVRTFLYGGSIPEIIMRDLTTRLATQTRVLLQTIGIFLFPVNLSIEHQVVTFQSFAAWPVLGYSIILSGILVLTLWWSRSPSRNRRLTAFMIAWFFVALTPIVLLPLHDILQENRAYLAVVGLIGLVALVMSRLLDWAKIRCPSLQPWIWGAIIMIILVYGRGTILRNQVWQDELTLWSDTVQKNPSSVIARDNLGVAYRRLGRLDEAADQFRVAIRLQPGRFVGVYNLGLITDKQGRYDEAERLYRQTLQLAPQFHKAHLALGLLYEKQGRVSDAIQEYSQTIGLDPELDQVRLWLGNALFKAGRYQDAAGEYETLLQKKLEDPELEAEVRTMLTKIPEKR